MVRDSSGRPIRRAKQRIVCRCRSSDERSKVRSCVARPATRKRPRHRSVIETCEPSASESGRYDRTDRRDSEAGIELERRILTAVAQRRSAESVVAARSHLSDLVARLPRGRSTGKSREVASTRSAANDAASIWGTDALLLDASRRGAGRVGLPRARRRELGAP